MTVQAWIVLTEEQKDDAEALNGGGVGLRGMAIDNRLANNLGYGTLVGLFVVPARLLNDPEYVRWYASLGTLPIHVMDSETLFLPHVDEE